MKIPTLQSHLGLSDSSSILGSQPVGSSLAYERHFVSVQWFQSSVPGTRGKDQTSVFPCTLLTVTSLYGEAETTKKPLNILVMLEP